MVKDGHVSLILSSPSASPLPPYNTVLVPRVYLEGGLRITHVDSPRHATQDSVPTV